MKKETFDRIELLQGDITTLQVDAVVNAANRSLLGGGGVYSMLPKKAKRTPSSYRTGLCHDTYSAYC